MAQLLIRRLDDHVKENLRRRAARNGVSMEEEARSILGAELSQPEQKQRGLGTEIAELFRGIDWGDEELKPLPREQFKPVNFDE